VAVTLQVTKKLRLELAGKIAIGTPEPCRLAMLSAGGTGHTAAPLATLQVTLVQLRPVVAGSVTKLLSALAGPPLPTDIV
jgi:hypothetical protein